jgi:hypothetical protein
MSRMSERIDPVAYCPERFLEDLRRTAAAIEAPFDGARVRRTLEVFDAELRRCVVQMKATGKPGSGLFYRFFYKWERDLTALAQEHGLVPPGHSPIIDLQADVLAHCRGATRAGLDLDTASGLAKVWTFTGGPTPVDEVLRLETIPQAARQQRRFFERHGLRHVFFVCSDFEQRSMNLYFGLEEDCRNEAWLRGLAAETGGVPEDPSVYRAMVASLAVSAGIGTTFSWDQPGMGRWSLYALKVPCDDPAAPVADAPGSPLPPLPPRLERFRDAAPTLNRTPQYNIAWSFGRAGFYTKMEKSYARDADHFLTVEMGGNLTHPAPAAEVGA